MHSVSYLYPCLHFQMYINLHMHIYTTLCWQYEKNAEKHETMQNRRKDRKKSIMSSFFQTFILVRSLRTVYKHGWNEVGGRLQLLINCCTVEDLI